MILYAKPEMAKDIFKFFLLYVVKTLVCGNCKPIKIHNQQEEKYNDVTFRDA